MMRVEVEIMLIQLRKNIALLWILRILAVPVVLVLFAAGFLLNLLYSPPLFLPIGHKMKQLSLPNNKPCHQNHQPTHFWQNVNRIFRCICLIFVSQSNTEK